MRTISTLSNKCSLISQAVFLSLCVRFQIAEIRTENSTALTTCSLAVASFLLGAFVPGRGLLAFTLAVPVLSGLAQTGFLNIRLPIEFTYTALCLGVAGRVLTRVFYKILHRKSSSALIFGPQRSAHSEAKLIGIKSTDLGANCLGHIADADELGRYPRIATEYLSAAIIISLTFQCWTHRHSEGLRFALLNQPSLGFSDPSYFLTASFVWLQGIFYFRLLYSLILTGDEYYYGRRVSKRFLSAYIRLLFVVYTMTMAVFLSIQFVFGIPERWTFSGYQSPYEDISSFGSIAVAVFAFYLASLTKPFFDNLILKGIALVVPFSMLVASWSRAAWLTGGLSLFIFAVFRLSRTCMFSLLATIVAVLALVNASANLPLWRTQPYLSRLVTLVRFENPANKSVERINLYKKASKMVSTRPLIGYGIGSFYLKSVEFGKADDLYRAKPDFSHNFFLQIAAELGVPVAILFLSLIAYAISKGFMVSGEFRLQTGCRLNLNRLACPLTFGLAAYLLTQMTANSLNVYVSHQLFFWFLILAVIATGD